MPPGHRMESVAEQGTRREGQREEERERERESAHMCAHPKVSQTVI